MRQINDFYLKKANKINLRQWQDLGMVSAQIGQELVYEPDHQGSRRVNPGYELGDDLEPIVDLYGPDALMESLVHVGLVAIRSGQFYSVDFLQSGIGVKKCVF